MHYTSSKLKANYMTILLDRKHEKGDTEVLAKRLGRHHIGNGRRRYTNIRCDIHLRAAN